MSFSTQRATRTWWQGGVFVLERWLSFIQARLWSHNEAKQLLIEDLSRLSMGRGAMAAMGFERHPELVCFMGPKASLSARAWPALSCAVYRQDLLCQYEDWTIADTTNTSAEKAHDKQVAETKQTRQSLAVYEAVCAELFQHVKRTGDLHSALSCAGPLHFAAMSVDTLLHSGAPASVPDGPAMELSLGPGAFGQDRAFFRVLSKSAGRVTSGQYRAPQRF